MIETDHEDGEIIVETSDFHPVQRYVSVSILIPL